MEIHTFCVDMQILNPSLFILLMQCVLSKIRERKQGTDDITQAGSY